MDLLTLIGLALGLGVVYYVMLQGKITALLLNFNAFLLVFGGTFASTLISNPWKIIRRIPRAFLFMFFPPKQKPLLSLINQIIDLQNRALSGGIDILSEDLEKIDDKFLVSGIKMLLEGHPGEVIRENLEDEIIATRRRHQRIIGVFRSMGSYAPIFGLLGTLIGVVQVLRNLANPELMGASMAIAITTTFYGIFGANFLFLPIAGKLEGYSSDEMMLKELMIVGILSIKNGLLPILMRRRLERFLSEEQREISLPR